MNTSISAEKKAKYIASIIYLLVMGFIVGGSYINQQMQTSSEIINSME